MSPLIFQILQLGLTLVEQNSNGKTQTDAEIAAQFAQIGEHAYNAVKAHSGEAIDPSNIKPEPPIVHV
jgi:hypothetical protein